MSRSPEAQARVNLFLQLNRDIGTLVEMLGDRITDAEARQVVQAIAERMDEATVELQKILYPESVTP